MANKRLRKKLAKSELWLHLAMTAQRWSDEVAGAGPVVPMSRWGDDDPLVKLCRTYGLTEADLTKLLKDMADELENRAMRAGYEHAWV